MPKILITGNGFDLNLNLPTSYINFIKVLNNLEFLTDYTFEKIYSPCTNFEELKYSFKNSIDFDKSEILNLKSLLKNNLWYKFFKSELNIESWIDFEQKIEYVLRNIFKSLDILKDSVFSSGPINPDSRRVDSTHFRNDIEAIETLKAFNLIEQDISTYILSELLFIKKYDYNISFNYNEISNYLYKELLTFKEIFNIYFEIFIIPLYDNAIFKVDSNYFNKINYHFTFNYTPTFEKLYGKNIKTNYLHGKINSKSNNIVLGINDLPSKENKDNLRYYIPFTKYYQKLNNATDYYFLNEISEKRTNENYVFYFVGHSLDKSDEDYINEVFDFILELKSKIKKIVIGYHSQKSKSSMLANLIEIRGKDDIVLLMREKSLVFYELSSKEFNDELNANIKVASIKVRSI